MRRILVASDLWLPFPGGAERLMFNLARDLSRRGHEVQVITGYELAQPFDGPTVTIDMDLPLDDDGARRLAAYIEGFAPDVIVTHHIYAHFFHSLFAGCGIPVVQVVLNGRRMPEAALAVYISRWVADQYGDAREGDMVITPPALPDIVADKHGDAIGFIKPIEHKGVELVYAIARALSHRPFIVLRGEWQDLEIIKPAKNIDFWEPVDDMRDFYAECRLMLMPSISEDAGTVAQEAAMNGIPCISSDVGGLTETNAGGIRLRTRKARKWADEIRRLDDPARYAEVVAAQRAALDAKGHGALLDEFAARIGAI